MRLASFCSATSRGSPRLCSSKGAPEFARQGFLEFAMDHFERHRKSMPRSHGSRHKLQAVGKQLFETLQPGFAFSHDIQHRKGSGGDRRQVGITPKLVGKQHPAQCPGGHYRDQNRIHQPVRAPLHAGLLQHFLQFGLQLEAAQELGRQQDVLLVGLDQRAAGDAQPWPPSVCWCQSTGFSACRGPSGGMRWSKSTRRPGRKPIPRWRSVET